MALEIRLTVASACYDLTVPPVLTEGLEEFEELVVTVTRFRPLGSSSTGVGKD